jgi:hypothetical protein
MCLMLYLGTNGNLPLRTAPDLAVEEVETSRAAVHRWFSLPTVRFIGAHTGCSCGFPYVVAEEPVDYWDGLFEPGDSRDADLRSLQALLTIVREHVSDFGAVELYPVWDGNEHMPPKGTVEVPVNSLDLETFLFTEQFFYRVKEGDDDKPRLSASGQAANQAGRSVVSRAPPQKARGPRV